MTELNLSAGGTLEYDDWDANAYFFEANSLGVMTERGYFFNTTTLDWTAAFREWQEER